MRTLMSGLSGWVYTRYSDNRLVQLVDATITGVGAALLILTAAIYLHG